MIAHAAAMKVRATASLFSMFALARALGGCGSTTSASEPAGSNDAFPDTPRSISTALFVASRDGSAAVVRVDAADQSVTAVTPALPAGFAAKSFLASAAGDRFVVSGATNGHEIVYAGTPKEWHVLSELAPAWWVTHASNNLELIAIAGFTAAGGAAGGRVMRFDGRVAKELGIELEPVALGDDAFVAVEYQSVRVDGTVVRQGTVTQPWRVFAADGTERGRLGKDRDPNAPAFLVDGGFVIQNDKTCSAFRWSEPQKLGATYGCEDVMPPLVIEGDIAYSARADGRDTFAHVPAVASATLAQIDAAGISVFVAIRPQDNTQLVTFATSDGARVTHEPGPAAGLDFGASWTRAASHAGFACALASRNGCAKGYTGSCKTNFVDVICSDAHRTRSMRLERGYDDNGNVVRGASEIVLTDDAAFVLWVDGGKIHRLDTHSFAETTIDDPWVFARRDGDVPTVFNRTLR